MIAVVPVREGVLSIGGEETICEASGRVLLAGDGASVAAREIGDLAHSIQIWETTAFQPGAWSKALSRRLADESIIILPASPDGRDLAPRLAFDLGRPLLARAVRVEPHRVVVARFGGQVTEEIPVTGPIVATLEPGVGNVEPTKVSARECEVLTMALPEAHDAEVIEVLPPDPSTVDLSEAIRIVAGGRGLGSNDSFVKLGKIAKAFGASFGATRAAADAGWAPSERFIGTSGVTVNPNLYIAMGISGAVQHISGLGQPKHIVSVNLDPSCPMMRMADLAIVSDAREVLRELAARLRVEVDSDG